MGMPAGWRMADDERTGRIQDDRLASPGRRFSDFHMIFPPEEGGYQEGDVATEQADETASGGSAERLDPFLFLTDISMGLDCIPRSCACGEHTGRQWAEGRTHGKKQPCPFDGKYPLGPFAGCCWLRGKVAEQELGALGEDALSWRMRDDMTHAGALAFADELATAADRLEREHAGDGDKPKGAGWSGRWNEEAKDFVWQTYSTFEEALAEIRTASQWYRQLGELGYGVHAWY